MSETIRNYLSCEGDFDSDGGWNGDTPDENRPAGRDLIEFMQSTLKSQTRNISEIWNEEGYGWSFNCDKDRTTVNVLVQFVDRWLIICDIVSFVPKLLRFGKFDAALKSVCAEIDRAARLDSRFRDLQWFTSAEYADFERKRAGKEKAGTKDDEFA